MTVDPNSSMIEWGKKTARPISQGTEEEKGRTNSMSRTECGPHSDGAGKSIQQRTVRP